MEKVAQTQSQIIAKFAELQKEAENLGLRIKNHSGFDVRYNDSLVNHYSTLDEVEIFLSGYKTCQMHEAAERNS